MQGFLEFLVYSNLLSAGCGLALYATTCLLTGISMQFSQAVLSFFSPLMLYTLLRMRGADQTVGELPSQRNQFMLRNKPQWIGVFWLAGVVTGMAALATWVLGGWEERMVLGVIALLVILYSWHIVLRKPDAVSLRGNAHLKVLTVSVVWVLMTVVLPVAAVLKTWDVNLWLHVIASAVLLVINVSYSEVADAEADAKFGTRTIANLLGTATVRQVCVALTVLVLGIQFFNCLVFGSDWPAFIAIFITNIQLLMVLYRSSLPEKEWQFPFYLDGLLVFRCFLLLLMKSIFTV